MATGMVSGFTARAMAGQGAMQQEQTRAQAQTRTQAKPQVQAESKARDPEAVSGKLVNVSDAGSGSQAAGQAVGANFGGADVQFSERSGVGFATKG